MAKKTITAYVVHKRFWNYNDEFYYVEGRMPTKSFLTREKAEAYRKQIEPAARRFDNPFECEGLGEADWTSLSKAELDAGLRKLGFTPPRDDDYFGWWLSEVGDTCTAEQRHGVYDLLDRVQFYEVVKTEVELEE